MNARNASREIRRAQAERNYAANQIARMCANGMPPVPSLLDDWRRATSRLRDLEERLRASSRTTKPQPQNNP